MNFFSRIACVSKQRKCSGEREGGGMERGCVVLHICDLTSVHMNKSDRKYAKSLVAVLLLRCLAGIPVVLCFMHFGIVAAALVVVVAFCSVTGSLLQFRWCVCVSVCLCEGIDSIASAQPWFHRLTLILYVLRNRFGKQRSQEKCTCSKRFRWHFFRLFITKMGILFVSHKFRIYRHIPRTKQSLVINGLTLLLLLLCVCWIFVAHAAGWKIHFWKFLFIEWALWISILLYTLSIKIRFFKWIDIHWDGMSLFNLMESSTFHQLQ